MKYNQLKPCPFCGGSAEVEQAGTNRRSQIIICTDCGCRMETGETCIDENSHWNVRVIPEKIIVDTSEDKFNRLISSFEYTGNLDVDAANLDEMLLVFDSRNHNQVAALSKVAVKFQPMYGISLETALDL